jgi:invasion protein IalB
MRLFTKISAFRILLAAGAVLVSQAALTETVQPKAKPGLPEAAEPTQSQAVQAAPRQPTWSMNCANRPEGLDCRAVQSLFFKNGRRLLSVVVHVPPDTKKPELLLQLPLGIYLPAGASLQIGEDEAKTLPFQSCDQFGCLATYAITNAEIAAMSNGSDLTIAMQNLDQQPVTVTVPVLGFAAAYAKVK